jgi:hypothetical protein
MTERAAAPAPFAPDWIKLQKAAYPGDNWRHVNADIHTVIEEYLSQLASAGLVVVRRDLIEQSLPRLHDSVRWMYFNGGDTKGCHELIEHLREALAAAQGTGE